jgi:hypothetical protein
MPLLGQFFKKVCRFRGSIGRIRAKKSEENKNNAELPMQCLLGYYLPALIEIFQQGDYFTNYLRVLFYVGFMELLAHKQIQLAEIHRYLATPIHIQDGVELDDYVFGFVYVFTFCLRIFIFYLLDCQFQEFDSTVIEHNNKPTLALCGNRGILICFDSVHIIAPQYRIS